MKRVYEGQTVATNPNINYDYIEIKYKKVNYLLKRKFITIPFDELSIKKQNCKTMVRNYINKWKDNENNGENSSSLIDTEEDSENIINSLKTSDEEDCNNIIDSLKTSDEEDCNNDIDNDIDNDEHTKNEEDRSNIIENYENCKDEIIVLNYIKENVKITREGILRYNEFVDFKTHAYNIVYCETYIVKKPFSVFVNYLNDMTIIKIIKHTKWNLNVEVDTGVIYEAKCENHKKESKYVIHGKPKKCKILAAYSQGIIKSEFIL